MPSAFAQQCLDLTGAVYEGLMGGSGSAVIRPDAYTVEGTTAELLIPQSGSMDDFSAWFAGTVDAYKPRQALRRVACEGRGWCVILTNPILVLSKQSVLGAGRASVLCSYLWTDEKGEPRLRYAHLSLLGVAANLSQGSTAPMRVVGPETALVMKVLGAKGGTAERERDAHDADAVTMFMLRGDDGGMHYFSPDQVVCIRADRNYVLIQGVDKTIRVRGAMTDVMSRMPGYMVRVHRSYAVNALRVRELREGDLVLDDGTRVPVPARKRAQVRDAIHAAQQASASR